MNQLYTPDGKCHTVVRVKFTIGNFHMKNVRGKTFSIFWDSLQKFFNNEIFLEILSLCSLYIYIYIYIYIYTVLHSIRVSI